MSLTDHDGLLLRRPLVAKLLAERDDALVVTGLGSPTYDVAAAGDQAENFYLWGAMGLAAMTGLGLAMAQPQRRVLVVTGDGEMLMGAGSLAGIAGAAPANLAILVLDNESFGETGRQSGLSGGRTEIAAMAKACGFADSLTLHQEDQLSAAGELLWRAAGPTMVVAKVALDREPPVLPSLDGAFLTLRMRERLANRQQS